MIAASLYIICALIALKIVLKYATGPAPLPYHAAILSKAGVELPRAVSGLLLAQYRSFACAMLAVSVAVVCIAIFGVANGAIWARVAGFVCILVFALPTALVGRKAERVTGSYTPWRTGALACGVAVLGFAVSWIE